MKGNYYATAPPGGLQWILYSQSNGRRIATHISLLLSCICSETDGNQLDWSLYIVCVFQSEFKINALAQSSLFKSMQHDKKPVLSSQSTIADKNVHTHSLAVKL